MANWLQMSQLAAGISTLALLAVGSGARADLTLTPSVTFDGTKYTYAYTIDNTVTPSAENVLLVNINTVAGTDAIFDVTAPTGFQAIYDSGLGIVSFLGDTQTFDIGTSFSGFSYDSLLPSGEVTFDTLSDMGNQTFGTTVGAVPEPGSVALLTAMLGTGAFVARRRSARKR